MNVAFGIAKDGVQFISGPTKVQVNCAWFVCTSYIIQQHSKIKQTF